MSTNQGLSPTLLGRGTESCHSKRKTPINALPINACYTISTMIEVKSSVECRGVAGRAITRLIRPNVLWRQSVSSQRVSRQSEAPIGYGAAQKPKPQRPPNRQLPPLLQRSNRVLCQQRLQHLVSVHFFDVH